MDELPENIVIGLETDPDADNKVVKTVYTKVAASGSCWKSVDELVQGSFSLLMIHFNQRLSIITLPEGAELPTWAKEIWIDPAPKKKPAAKRASRTKKGDGGK